MYHYCTGCRKQVLLMEKDGETFDGNSLMPPDVWMLGAYLSEGNGEPFILPISGLTAVIKEGKIYLEGKNND